MLSNMWFGLVRSVFEKVSEAVSVKCRQAVQSLLCLAFSKRGVRPTTSPASLTEIRLPANAGVKDDVRVSLSIFFSAGSNTLSSAPSKCLSSSPYRNQKTLLEKSSRSNRQSYPVEPHGGAVILVFFICY